MLNTVSCPILIVVSFDLVILRIRVQQAISEVPHQMEVLVDPWPCLLQPLGNKSNQQMHFVLCYFHIGGSKFTAAIFLKMCLTGEQKA